MINLNFNYGEIRSNFQGDCFSICRSLVFILVSKKEKSQRALSLAHASDRNLIEKIRTVGNFNEIRFLRVSQNDGFGFECMKMAYKFNLKGRMDYGPASEIVIRLQGENGNKTKFLEWLRSSTEIKLNSLYYMNSFHLKTYNEFDIYLQSN